jgi:hypothetical protein
LRTIKNIILLLLLAVFTGTLHAGEFFSIEVYDDISNQADIFPKSRLNFLTKFKRDSVLFDIDQKTIAEEVRIDSSFQYVIIYQRLFENDFKSSKVMNVSDFMDQKIKYENRKIWLTSVTKNLGIAISSGMFDGNEIALDIPFKIKSKTFHRVFGGNNIGLRVKGSLSISVIGQKSYTDRPNAENSSFDFTLDQTQNISIRGKVGTKVDIDIAQNTESFDFENSLKITYTGESDEIIQKMEAGNIGLSLPGTKYVSFSGVNKGLFGIKTETKVGKFKATSIASIEKGQKNQKEIIGGVTKTPKLINAKNYQRYKYFFIDSLFKANMASADNYTNLIEHLPLSAPSNLIPYKIKPRSFELYVTRFETGSQDEADIYIDFTRPAADSINGYSNLYEKNLRVKLVPEEDYFIDYELGYIRLKSFDLRSEEILAVKYIKQSKSNESDITEIGSIDSTGTKLELQILGEKDQEWKMPWTKLEWKNVYYLEGVDISKDDFKLTIQKSTAGGVRTDDYNNDSTPMPMPYLYWYQVNKKEINDEVDIGFLISANGEFIFPNQTPFMPDNNSIIYTEGSDPALFMDSLIYTDNKHPSSDFSLNFEFSSRSSTHSLGFNVIEGSEVVRSGATTLIKDVDYIINYNSGELSIINERYLTADILILFESASIFQLDQKMLLGNRIEYNINKDSYIGATVLYLSEETNEEKVHVGYEPKRNLVLDLNGQTSFDLPYLTKAVDWLPLVETDKESKLSFEGEIARIIPNPNPLDAAYIDDFESSKIKKSLGMTYGTWKEASLPDNYLIKGEYDSIPDADSLNIPFQYFLKSYSGTDTLSYYWYNPKDEDKLTKEKIYIDTPADQLKDKVSTLNIVFRPSLENEAIRGNTIKPEDSWGGIMKYLNSSYQDMREVKYIEFLAQTNEDITLNIDIGDLSEDVIPDGKKNSEDMNSNGVLDIENGSEDTGLDMMKSDSCFNALYKFDPDSLRSKEPYEFYSFDTHPTKDGDDDTPIPDSQITDYWDLIKTERNGKMDTEDLDGGGNLDTSIRAYRYSLVLKSDPSTAENFVVSTNFYPKSNFALYRIPIEKFSNIINREPDLSKMKYIKLWVNNSQTTLLSTKIDFVSLDLVGNEWAAKGTNIGKIEAKTINNQDDKGRYYSPPGVKKFDDNGFEEPEQSLSVNVSLSSYLSQFEFENGRYAFLTKGILNGENYLQYEEIKMFIHGGTQADDPLWDVNRPLYFIYRFGTDSVNYYEYRSRLVKGWKNDLVNNQMVIKLNDLTNLKTLRSDSNMPVDSIFLKDHDNENIKRYIGIKGNPTFQSIKYFNAGVLDSASVGLDTEIWLDELRLAKVIKDPGTAMRVKGRLEVADIASVDAEITKQDENFHRIEDNKGSGINQLSTSLNSSINLEKFTPKKFGLSLPVRYSYSNTDSYTKYQGTTDIIVDKNNIPDSVRTENTRNSYDFSIRKTTRSDNPFLKYSVDNLSFNGIISFSEGSNPSYIRQNTESYGYTLSYSLGLPESWFSVNPFIWGKEIFFIKSISGTKFNFFPALYNFSVNTNQSENTSLTRRYSYSESRSFLLSRNFSTSLTPFPFIKSEYSLSLKSDMYKDIAKDDSTGEKMVIINNNRDLGDLFSLEFGELSSYESSLNNNMKMNLSKYVVNDVNFKTAYSWSSTLSKVSNNIKNRYDSKLNSRIKTKEIIQEIQKGINYILPEKKTDTRTSDPDKTSDKNKLNPNDSTKVIEKPIEKQGSEGTARLSRSGSPSAGSKKSALDFLKENLSDLSLSYAQGRENSFSNIPTLDQANPAFIFGFANRPEDADYVSSSWSGSWALNGSTKLGLTKNISLEGISYQFTRAYRDNSNEGFTGNDSETRFVWPWVTDEEHKKTGATAFPVPNYSIGISGLQDMLKAKDQITSLTISHSKTGSEAIVWYVDGKTPGLYLTGIPDVSGSDLKIISASYTSGFSPLAGVKIGLKNGFSFGANYDYSFDMKETYTYADNKRAIQSGEKKYTKELRITAGYNQKGGFSVPFNFWPFKGAKLDNDITYSLSVSYNSNNRHNYDKLLKEYESLDNGVKSINFTISPDITYTISRKLNGSAAYSYNYNETKNYEARSVVNTNHKFELKAVLSITGN